MSIDHGSDEDDYQQNMRFSATGEQQQEQPPVGIQTPM
jgi:hypothetical protein